MGWSWGREAGGFIEDGWTFFPLLPKRKGHTHHSIFVHNHGSFRIGYDTSEAIVLILGNGYQEGKDAGGLKSTRDFLLQGLQFSK